MAWIEAFWGFFKSVSNGIESVNLILEPHGTGKCMCGEELHRKLYKKTDLDLVIGHNPRLCFNCQRLARVLVQKVQHVKGKCVHKYTQRYSNCRCSGQTYNDISANMAD